MVFEPQQPYPKSQGDVIRSGDWNAAIDEILRLEDDKVNRAGDTIIGSLRWGNNSELVADQGGSIELGGNNATPGTGTPYIDFHRGPTPSAAQDYNTRIINDADGRLSLVAPTLRATGNVGIGTTDPQGPRAKLEVSGGAIMPAVGNSRDAGIQFPLDPGGGGGDEAFIRYFAESGETTKLLIGCQNDADDRISLYQFGEERLTVYSGNVGIGTTSPGARLDVSGSGGATQCCAPVAPTLSIAEASNSANRQAWLQFHNSGEAESYIRLAGGGPAGSGREGERRLEIGDSQGANTGLRLVAGALSLPKTTDGYAALTNWRGGGADLFFSDNPVGTLRLAMAPFQPLDAPVPPYTFAVGHPGVVRRFPFNVPFNSFHTKFSVNQDGNVVVAGNLTVVGTLNASTKNGYVVDNFINGVGGALEQGDVLVISSTDSSRYSARNNSIPLIEGDLTDAAYDSRVCGIVDVVVTEDELPLVEENRSPSLEDIAADVNATQAAVERAVELGINPFELKNAEGTGSGGRVLVDDVETVAESGEVSSTSGLTEAGPGALLNPLAQFAGEVTSESDATKIEAQQMGRMVTLGAFAHCKVDADIAPISTGDLLTTSSTKGHAQKVLEPEKAAGAIVGKALASLDGGRGKIPVLVMLQ